jgi:phosphohistidine phosphatase
MKRLLLIRHAKAEGHAATDFERPLSARGYQDAQGLARHLQSEGLLPQLMISSPAARTQATAKAISNQLIPIQYEPSIYEASEQTLLQVINQLPDEYEFAALVGHNPGIAYLLLNLSGEVRDVPPGTAILLTFDVKEWMAISHQSGAISHYYSPNISR